MPAFERSVLENCAYRATRIESDAAHFQLENVERGVVFAHADWSGSSYACLKDLCIALDAQGTGIPLFVLNSDTLSESLAEDLFGRIPEGWGETAWVRGGRVVGRTPYKGRPAAFLGQIIKDLT